MRLLASIEALLAWILFFGNGYFMDHRKLVDALLYPEYRTMDEYVDVDGSNGKRSKHWYRGVHHRIGPKMTCNCSWGSVPGNQVKAKIVGGKIVGRRENYPMMAGLQDNIEECMYCGGTVLTEYHVLTAAHCIYDEDPKMVSIVVGVKSRCRERDGGGQYIPMLDTVYIHDYYDPDLNHNDIAIVLAKKKIIFTNNVGPVCIHTEPFTSRSEHILILGWGKVGEALEQSKYLLRVLVKRVDTKVCQKRLPRDFINDNFHLQICTYGGAKDACGGDSGGPLFVVDRSMNRLVQVALVSMGKGCARYGVPAVNTALFPYLGWMQWTIQRSMRRHFFKKYKKCGDSFCYIIDPNVG